MAEGKAKANKSGLKLYCISGCENESILSGRNVSLEQFFNIEKDFAFYLSPSFLTYGIHLLVNNAQQCEMNGFEHSYM